MAQIAGLAQSRMEFWRKHIEAHEQGGLGVAEYCRRHRLCSPTFYVWRRRLSKGAEAHDCQDRRLQGTRPPDQGCPDQRRPDLALLDSTSSLLFQEVRLPVAPACSASASANSCPDVFDGGHSGVALAHETGWHIHLRRGFDENALRRVLRLFSCPPDSQTRALHSLAPEAGSC